MKHKLLLFLIANLFCLPIFSNTDSLVFINESNYPPLKDFNTSFTQETTSSILNYNEISKLDSIISNYSTTSTDANINIQENKNSFWESNLYRFIIPGAFTVYGLSGHFFEPFQDFDYGAKDEVLEHNKNKFPYDDYLQYAPVAAVFALDPLGVKAQHNFRDRALLAGTSYLTMAIVVNTLKSTTGIDRPDHSAQNSFPSGHTATAFVCAHLLMKEYYRTSPWIGAAGYLAACGTGAMRILNNKHWLSDVIGGAGIGMLSVELAYILLPTWHKLLKIDDSKKKSLAIVPTFGVRSYGLGMSYRF